MTLCGDFWANASVLTAKRTDECYGKCMDKHIATPEQNNESKAERAARILRNLNALGALALGGAALLAPPAAAAALGVLAAVDVAQAGGFELARQYAKRKRQRKG